MARVGLGGIWLSGLRMGAATIAREPVLGLKKLILPATYWRSVEFQYVWNQIVGKDFRRLLARRSKAEGGLLDSAYIRLQVRWMAKEERLWCPRVAMNVLCSDVDRDALRARAPETRAAVTPNGVDAEEFQPLEREASGSTFVGATSCFPNLDALEHFANDILPMGCAVVTTSIGCAGLEAVDGENTLIRDGPADFAPAVIEVERNPWLRARLGAAVCSTAETVYIWTVIGRDLVSLYRDVAAGRAL